MVGSASGLRGARAAEGAVVDYSIVIVNAAAPTQNMVGKTVKGRGHRTRNVTLTPVPVSNYLIM